MSGGATILRAAFLLYRVKVYDLMPLTKIKIALRIPAVRLIVIMASSRRACSKPLKVNPISSD